MLHIKVPQIDEIVEGAINKATDEKKPQLISFVNEIEYTDAFTFLDRSQKIDRHRLFWKSADEDFTMAGVGAAYKMIAAHPNRFRKIESTWNELLDEAQVYDPHYEKGTGLVALGGFSFDANQNNSTPWEGFPDSQMTIPAYLLTNKGSKSYLTTNLLIFEEDHKQQIIRQIDEHQHQLLHGDRQEHKLPKQTGLTEMEAEKWKQSVKQATADIKQGKLGKVVLARELRVKFDSSAELSAIVEELCKTQENSYIFVFENGGDYFIGATPERLAKLENQELVSTCLAGTIPRGKDEKEDHLFSKQLLNDPKNRQEHDFVVQMIREAVEACCYNVEIPSAPVVYPLRNLQHLYTPVTATLEQGYTLLDVVEKLHPTPALGGMPQKQSVDYIRKHEVLNRGWYAGPIGWFDGHNNGEFAVAIRSALLQQDEASLFAGCGVVEDSNPDAEYEETAVKLRPMLSVLGGSV